MSEKVEIVLDGKDAGLVRAWLAGRDSVAAYEAGLKKLEPVTRENAKAAADFERAAKQAYEATRTPLEKFNREQEKLDDLFATGLIDVQTYNRALQQQKQILEQSDAALQSRLQTERQQAALAARVIESLITPQERYAAKLKELSALQAAGKLTADQFAAAVRREKAALDATDEALLKQKHDQEQLGASAKRVIESILTPQEKYSQKMAGLNQLLKVGALNQNQFNRAAAQAKVELDAAGKAGDTAGTAVRNFVSRFAGVAGVVGGLTAIAGQLRREYDNLLDRQKTAADRQIDVATAQKEAYRNLSADDDMTQGQLDEAVNKTMTATGASAGAVWKATSGALSFKGGLKASQAAEAVRIAAELNPEDPAAMEANTTAILNLMTRDKKLKAKDIAGFFLAAKQASPTVTDAQFAQNIAPGIGQGMAFGESAREAAALRATLGTGIGDQEGRVTATAAIQLERQLAIALPKVAGGTIGRLKFLHSPQGRALQKKLLGSLDEQAKATGIDKGDLTSEAKAFTSVVDLVKGGTGMSELLDTNLQKIPEVVGAGHFMDESQERINAAPLQQAAATKRAFDVLQERLQLSDLGGGLGAIAREGVVGSFKNAGATDIEQRAVKLGFELSTNGGAEGAVEDAIGRIEDLAKRRAAPKVTFIPGNEVGDPGARLVDPASPRDLEIAALLRESVAVLKDIRAKPVAKKDNRQPPAPVPAAALGGPQ